MHKKKISECNVINSVNPLYLRIININGQFKKDKDDAWYLVIFDKDFYKKIVDFVESIKNKIIKKTWDTSEYDKDYMKIKFENNNIFPVDKDVNIYTATIIIRVNFAKDGKYHPQLFLDDGLYKNVSA